MADCLAHIGSFAHLAYAESTQQLCQKRIKDIVRVIVLIVIVATVIIVVVIVFFIGGMTNKNVFEPNSETIE